MANTYLTKTFGSAGSLTTWTLSFWVKKAGNGIEQRIFSCDDDASGNNDQWMKFDGSDILQFSQYQSAYTQKIETNRKFRDNNGWYHIVLVWDTTNGTAGDRTRIYINGVRETSFSSEVQASSSLGSLINNTTYPLEIGRRGLNGSQFFTGSLSHVHFIDGTAYDASAFGETDATTGEWKIKTSPSVTYGTNGFFILKDGNSVTDQSGNSNNFTVGGGTLTKTEDCPSNVFATWNPLQATTSASYDFTSGNTRIMVNDVDMSCGATLGAKTGKFYMEMKWVQQGGNDRWGIQPVNSNVNQHVRTNGVGWNQSSNEFYMLGSSVSGSWGGSIGTSDIIQLAMDLDNGALYLGVNGTWRNSGSPTSGSSKTGAVDFSGTSLFGEFLTFAVGKGNNGTSGWNANFGNGYIEQTAVSSAGTNASGNGIFEYDVPTGYTALSTKGLNL